MTQSGHEKALRRFLARRIAERAKRVKRALARVRDDPSPAATHALATALRRFLVCDSVLRTLFGRRLLAKGRRRRLKAFRRQLGVLRDQQEIGLRLMGMGLEGSFAGEYADELHRRGQAGAKCLGTTLRGQGFRWLAPRGARRGASDILRRCKGCLRGSVRDLLAGLAREVFRLRGQALSAGNDLLLHRLRIALKRFRYAVELLAPDFSGATEADLRRLRALQTAMGTAHDWLVLEADARAFAKRTRARGAPSALSVVRRRRVDAHREARRYVSRELDRLVMRLLQCLPSCAATVEGSRADGKASRTRGGQYQGRVRNRQRPR